MSCQAGSNERIVCPGQDQEYYSEFVMPPDTQVPIYTSEIIHAISGDWATYFSRLFLG